MLNHVIIEDEDFEDDALEVTIVEEEVVQDEVRRPRERGQGGCGPRGEVVNDEYRYLEDEKNCLNNI